MPRKKAIIKSFEEWKKKQEKRNVKNFKKFSDNVNAEQLAEELLTEEKIYQLFSLVEKLGQAEIKVKLAVEEFEKISGKSLNVNLNCKI